MTLATRDLAVTRGGACILDAVSTAFAPGRVTALIGPNGAGKSTLLSCLAGLLAADRGQATLDGKPIAQLDRRERARAIGLLPQAHDVHWDIDVETLVGLGRLPWRGRGAITDADRAAIGRAMAATDVAPFAKRGVKSLSGGERARVLLARVLAGEPRWLLADEPLASLDPAHQQRVALALKDVAAAGTGVIVVMHDLTLAARIAQDAVLLGSGRVAAAGAIDTVLTPDRLGAVYGTAIETGVTQSGARYILPSENLTPARPTG